MGIFSKWFSSKKADDSDSVEPQKPQVTAADYCEQGRKSLDAGRYVEAMEYFQAAIEADNQFEMAYLLLSSAFEKQEKTDKAKAALYGLLAVNPNSNAGLKRLEQLNHPMQQPISSPVVFGGQPQSSADITEHTDNNTISVNPQVSTMVNANYRIYDGKDSDCFDFFVIFEDGNRLYFKRLNSIGMDVAVVAPNGIWSGYKQPKGSVAIPPIIEHNGKKYVVKEIGRSAFVSCGQIESVIIPDTVTAILNSAFDHCISLNSIKLSSILDTIGDSCFVACPFGNIDIPDCVNSIGNKAFSECDNLTSFRLPKNLELVESELFTGCSKLDTIRIPENVKVIRNFAFGDNLYMHGSNTIRLIMTSSIPPSIGGTIVRNGSLRHYRPNQLIKVEVLVPQGALEAYMIAQYWQLFDIKEM